MNFVRSYLAGSTNADQLSLLMRLSQKVNGVNYQEKRARNKQTKGVLNALYPGNKVYIIRMKLQIGQNVRM
jgi:hypothetical protein